MATLQKTIVYPGSSLPGPMRLVFKIPTFKYTTFINPRNEFQSKIPIVQREQDGSFDVTEIISGSKSYVATIDESSILGQNDIEVRKMYFENLMRFDLTNRINIEDCTSIIKVEIRNSENDTLLHEVDIEAIDLVVSGKNGFPTVFINKSVYTTLVKEISFRSFDRIFLNTFRQSLREKKGKFEVDQATFNEMFVVDLSYALDLGPKVPSDAQAMLTNILEKVHQFKFSTLFDFPITIPTLEIKEKIIGGTFTIDTQLEVKAKELDFYGLALEYNNGNSAKVIPFDWATVEPALTSESLIENKSLKFKFTVKETIEGILNLGVKGVNGSVLWFKEFSPNETSLDKIAIRVPLMRPNTLNSSTGNQPTGGVGKKLRGQVIQTGKAHSLNALTVLIQAQKEGDAVSRIVGSAQTDANGNFFLNYPYGNYKKAEAIVSLVPDSPTDIEIRANKPEESIADDFLYLLIDLPESEVSTEDDCDCHTPKKAKRLPDQTDLIESDGYTQDMGGGCINLSTPNRTLREYDYQAIVRTSDPDVANYKLEKTVDQAGNISFQLSGDNKTIKRGEVNLANPIRWQDAPDSRTNPDAPDSANTLSIYQAVTVATGHILHYKSVFKADGYSLGELVYSLPLAPGQKKQIVVFDSSHTLTGAESQTISQGERLAANLISDRSITDQLGGAIGEAMDGRSSASTSGVSAGLGLGGSLGPISGVLGVSGGYSNSNSTASQNSSRNISQFFGEQLRQSLMQNAESYRQLNASVVTTVREGQQYAVTTEVVANHNHCHALTMMYFEVLRHYAIYQELADVEECIFVPLLMTNFTTENIYKWKDVLASNLLPLPSSTYLQPASFLMMGRNHPLLRAFDANERIKTNYAHVEDNFPRGIYADEKITEFTGEIRVRINIPRPKTRFDRILSFPVVKKTVTSRGDVDVAGTISENIKDSIVGALVPCAAKGPSVKYNTNTTEVLTRSAIFDLFMTLDGNFETVPPAQCIRVNFDGPNEVFSNPISLVFHGDNTPTPMDFFAGMDNEKALWTAYSKILGFLSVKELFKYFNGNLVSDWDRIFNDNIAPLIIERLIGNNISFSPLGTVDLTPQSKYHGGEQILTWILRGSSSITRKEIDRLTINYSVLSNLTSVEREMFFNYITLNIESVKINYSTNFSSNILINKTLRDDLRDGVLPIPTPLDSEEKRNPREEDKFMVRQLIEHLNSNLEYYNRVLWYKLDTERRYMLLEGFHIQIFSDFGNPIGYRSLASVVKNQMITITGNSMVFPVAAGYRVSQSYIMESTTEVDGASLAQTTLLDHYKPLTPMQPYRLSVPTRGVYLEAVQGACDACEKVKPNSSQDWDKFRADEPTSILPVTTPTPVVTDWKAVFKDFAQPLVSIQNAPNAPAPGAGLAGLNELLGKAGVFTDITGLQGNQQNAIKTYLSNQENVKALAEMAKTMAMQQHNTENSQSITDSLTQARDTGAITPEEHSTLTQQHLEQQIDGGESRRQAELVHREETRPSLADAAIDAASSGRRVTAQRTDTDGNVESVSIDSSGANPSEGTDVGYEVPTLRQPSSDSCWATAATMMMSWKARQSLTIEAVLRKAGKNLTPQNETKYLTIFNDNTGLRSSDKPAFIQSLNMVGEAPANYSLAQYIEWFRTFGPLWVTTDAATATGSFSPHARILTKIKGDPTDPQNVVFTFNDPVTGTESTSNFSQFVSQFEQMVTDNPGNLFVQIVHFKDLVDKTKGSNTEGSNTDLTPLPDTTAWTSLKRFIVPAAIQTEIQSRGFVVQNLFDASMFSSFNFDYYSVVIDTMPRNGRRGRSLFTAESLLEYIRNNLNRFYDPGWATWVTDMFQPYEAGIDDTKWNSRNPLGAVLFLDIWGPDNGAVVCSEKTANHWRFSTVRVTDNSARSYWGSPGGHPVSGHREFGFVSESGKVILYTRGLDRMTGNLESLGAGFGFRQQRLLWETFQDKVVGFVNNNGGVASIATPINHHVSNTTRARELGF
jgi:Papain-like cysteine protease AvrRpt2